MHIPFPSPSSPSAVPQPSALGVVGRYELLLQLAAGGMGSVYVGRQVGAAGFEKVVAIKRLHPHWVKDPEMRAGFREEARIASLIRHPNVVPVLDVYEESDEQLIVMEYVEGTTLSAVLTALRKVGRPVPVPVALRVAIELLRGLHAAHETRSLDGQPLDVVHRDVSPQNILLGVRGTVAITDFGIAKAKERAVRTATGELKGKIRYMAPEQARGLPVDRRTDVFAAGLVLWEMLTGTRAYRGGSDMEALQLAAAGAVQPLRAILPALPAELDALLAAALAPNPAQRFQSAAVFLATLEAFATTHKLLASSEELTSFVATWAGDEITQQSAKVRTALITRSGLHPAAVAPAAEPRTLTTAVSVVGPATDKKSRWLLPLFLGALTMLALGLAFGLFIANRKLARETGPSSASASDRAGDAARSAAPSREGPAPETASPVKAASAAAASGAASADASASATPSATPSARARPLPHPVLLPPPP